MNNHRFLFYSFFILSICLSYKVSAQVSGNLWNYGFRLGCSLPYTDSIEFSIGGNCTAGFDSDKVYINFGDGTDTSFFVHDCPGNYFYKIGHTYTTGGTFYFTVIETDTIANTSDTLRSIDQNEGFIVSSACATVTGHIYMDLNHNCTYITGEKPIGPAPYGWIYINLDSNFSTGGVYGSQIVDTSGYYEYHLPVGHKYDIYSAYYADSSLNHRIFVPYPNCPTSTVDTVNVTNAIYYNGVDFGYQCDTSSLIDAYSMPWAFSFRPGFQKHLYVFAGSVTKMCDSVSAVLTLTLDSHLSYVSMACGMPPDTINGNTLKWNITSTNGIGNGIYDLIVYCDTNVQIGDSLCISSNIIVFNYTDTFLSNNSFGYCPHVSNSFDPNSKIVFPKGEGSQGFIDKGTALNYLINFHNTGNDTAINIIVKDTLSTNLDTNTVTILESTAPVTLSRNKYELTFSFANIMLPDSSTNEAASHGSVMYSVNPIRNVSGLVIKNRASIYFDQNAPIITNITLNTVKQDLFNPIVNLRSETAQIYPNPANNLINIKFDNLDKFQIYLLDISGRVLGQTNGQAGKAILETSSYSNGLYFIQIQGTEIKNQTYKVILSK